MMRFGKISFLLFLFEISFQSACGENLFVYPDVFNDTDRDVFEVGSFPKDFQFGVATSAYQVRKKLHFRVKKIADTEIIFVSSF